MYIYNIYILHIIAPQSGDFNPAQEIFMWKKDGVKKRGSWSDDSMELTIKRWKTCKSHRNNLEKPSRIGDHL